jgi:hypothetical protein
MSEERRREERKHEERREEIRRERNLLPLTSYIKPVLLHYW